MMNRGLLIALVLMAWQGFAETRCIIQVTSGDKNMNIIQLCSTDRQGNMKLPLPVIAPYNQMGPKAATLPVKPEKIRFKTQGCQATAQKDAINIQTNAAQSQVQASYSFPHKHRDYFVIFKNITPENIDLQVVTRSTPLYYPQVRPLRAYAFSQEEDDSGAWQYMNLLSPIGPGDQVVIIAARQPDKGFAGGWGWLWGALAGTLFIVVVAWRRNA